MLANYMLLPPWLSMFDCDVTHFSFGPGRVHATGPNIWVSAEASVIVDLVPLTERPSKFRTGEDLRSSAILSTIAAKFATESGEGLAPGVHRFQRGALHRYTRMSLGVPGAEDSEVGMVLLGVPLQAMFLMIMLARMPEEQLYCVPADLPLDGPRSKARCLAIRFGTTKDYCAIRALRPTDAATGWRTTWFNADAQHERDMDALAAALRVVGQNQRPNLQRAHGGNRGGHGGPVAAQARDAIGAALATQDHVVFIPGLDRFVDARDGECVNGVVGADARAGVGGVRDGTATRLNIMRALQELHIGHVRRQGRRVRVAQPQCEAAHRDAHG